MPGLHYPLFLYLALVVARWRRSLVSLCMSCVLLTSSMLRGFHPLSSSRLCAFAPPRSVRFGSVRIGSVWFGSDRIGSFFIFEQARAEAAGEVLRSWKRCIGTLREQKKKKEESSLPIVPSSGVPIHDRRAIESKKKRKAVRNVLQGRNTWNYVVITQNAVGNTRRMRLVIS